MLGSLTLRSAQKDLSITRKAGSFIRMEVVLATMVTGITMCVCGEYAVMYIDMYASV